MITVLDEVGMFLLPQKANIKKVRDRLHINQTCSVRKMVKEMAISEPSMGRIVKKHLNKKTYKQGKGQLLSDASKTKRKERSKKLLHRFRSGAHRNILFTDEKIFSVEQFFNKQNDRLYASSKPNTAVKRTGHPKTLMVFAGITANGRLRLSSFPKTSRSTEATIWRFWRMKFSPGPKGTLETDNGVSNRTELQPISITPCRPGASRTSRTLSTSTSGLHQLLTLIRSTTPSGVFWSRRHAPSLIVTWILWRRRYRRPGMSLTTRTWSPQSMLFPKDFAPVSTPMEIFLKLSVFSYSVFCGE